VKSSNTATENYCPCGSDKPYSDCCEPFHLGQSAPTAETLMRSRYTAFTLGLEPYLLQTWHKNTRPPALNLADDESTQWLALQIKSTAKTNEHSATVAFVAHYKIAGRAYRMYELSEFLLVDGLWFYLSGILMDAEKLNIVKGFA
jgi:SEC-C motif-containing protein